MDNDWDADGDAPDAGQDAQTLADEARALFEAARARAETELAFQKARAGLAAKWGGFAAGLGCLIMALLFVALMAAVFGVVLALTQTLGAWAATGIVVGTLVLLAVIAGLVAFSQMRRIARLMKERP